MSKQLDEKFFTKDQTNKKNILTLLGYVIVLFVCVALIIVMSIWFGTGMYGQTKNPYGYSTANVGFHDHRL